MQIHWTYTGCDTDDERRIERLWEDGQTAIEAKLAEIPAEPSELRLAVHHDTEADDWSMQAALHLPARTLVAEAESDSVESVFRQVFRKLAKSIGTCEEQTTRVVDERSGMHAVLPFLEQFHTSGRSRAFFAFLVPLMRSLRPYVRRQLEILQIDESLPEESLSASDVLDEAMLRAWERFDRRPASLPIDLWLTRIVDEVLESIAGDEPLESLDERMPAPLPKPDDDASADFWVEREDDPETIEFGDLLEGPEGIDEWDRLDIDVKRTRLVQFLNKLPREQRQTMLLLAAEGFEPGVVADLQNRSVDAVEADMEAARRTLVHELGLKPRVEEIEKTIDRPRSRNRRRRRR